MRYFFFSLLGFISGSAFAALYGCNIYAFAIPSAFIYPVLLGAMFPEGRR